MKRDYNKEAHDSDRKYAYDFDNVLRYYMMDTFRPYVKSPKGRVLEM